MSRRFKIAMMTDTQSVAARMQELVYELENASDRRAIFLYCYMMMTENMLTAIEAGEFKDPDWVHLFLERFADYYFDALNAYEVESPSTPAVWRLAHRAALEPQTLVLQNLMLGINAHINYDLVLTLVEILDPEWRELTTGKREERHSDYCQVNEIIQRTIDLVQDEVVERYSPLMDVIDKTLGPLDEWLTSLLISQWRDEVWDRAIGLMGTVGTKEQRKLLDQLEAITLKKADAILFNHPPSA